MARLADYASLLEALEHQGFRIKANQCIAVRNRTVQCGRCAEACVSGCIQVENRALSINPEQCIGCGSCATACPTGAIATVNPDDHQIIEEMAAVQAHNDGLVVIACASMLERAEGKIDGDAVVKVACLGRIDEAALVHAAAQGARKIVLVSDACETCAYATGRRLIDRVVTGAQALLAAWNSPCRIKLGTTFPRQCARGQKDTYDLQRREFLLGMKDMAATSARQTAELMINDKLGMGEEEPAYEHVTDDGTLPHRLPARRVRLLQSLNDLGKPAAATVPGRLWHRVVIDEQRCSGCQMCAVFCPSGALAKHQEIDEAATQACNKLFRAPGNPRSAAAEGAAKPARPIYKRHKGPSASSSFAGGEQVDLLFTPRLCLGCDSCRQLCPQRAIRIEEGIDTAHITSNATTRTPLKDIAREKGGPDAIRNSMSKLIDSPFLWG